jgi:hypothetical protein
VREDEGLDRLAGFHEEAELTEEDDGSGELEIGDAHMKMLEARQELQHKRRPQNEPRRVERKQNRGTPVKEVGGEGAAVVGVDLKDFELTERETGGFEENETMPEVGRAQRTESSKGRERRSRKELVEGTVGIQPYTVEGKADEVVEDEEVAVGQSCRAENEVIEVYKAVSQSAAVSMKGRQERQDVHCNRRSLYFDNSPPSSRTSNRFGSTPT